MRFKEYLKLEEQLPGGLTRGTAPFDIKKKKDLPSLEKSEKDLFNHANKVMRKLGLFQRIRSVKLTAPNKIEITVPTRTGFILDDKLAALLGKDPFFKALTFGKDESIFIFSR